MSDIAQGGRFRIGGETEIHRLGYGALHLLQVGADACGPPAPGVDVEAVLKRVVALGVDLIDTANIYGPGVNEEQIRAALHPYRGLTLSTKGGLTRPRPAELTPDYSEAHLRAAVEGSLRRLGVEHLDVWTLHHVDPSTPIEDVVGVMSRLQREGKIRHLGLSKANPEQLARACREAPIAMVQNRYNVADRRDDAMVEYCRARGIGFMAFFPLASGRTERLAACTAGVAARHEASIQQIALAWLLQRAPVMIPIPGTGVLAELEANVAACAIRLSAADVAEIDARHAELPPIQDGPSPIKLAAAS